MCFQVHEVIDVMRDNVAKVMEREGKLSDLDTRAANLEQSAVNFTTSSKRLRKKYCRIIMFSLTQSLSLKRNNIH